MVQDTGLQTVVRTGNEHKSMRQPVYIYIYIYIIECVYVIF